MVEIKIIRVKTEFKRTPTTTFLYTLNNNQLICSECSHPIENDTYAIVCSDLNKIWHETCERRDHIKTTFKIIRNLRHHYDWFCLIRYLDKETYDSFDAKPIELNTSVEQKK